MITFTGRVDLSKVKVMKCHLLLDRPIVLSVGWIASAHKRMDYVVDEMAQLPGPRPFLVMLGAMDESSGAILDRATRALGNDGFAARTVAPEAVGDYYRAADVFALASLREGFGRVFLEATMHGLPVIAHRHPVMEYVLRENGVLTDLSLSGALATALANELSRPDPVEMKRQRWLSTKQRFGWDSLRDAYRDMFLASAKTTTMGARA